jgi:hypothetical protein
VDGGLPPDFHGTCCTTSRPLVPGQGVRAHHRTYGRRGRFTRRLQLLCREKKLRFEGQLRRYEKKQAKASPAPAVPPSA